MRRQFFRAIERDRPKRLRGEYEKARRGGSCRLYEDESGFWLETELDLDSTELSWEGKAALEKSGRVRSISFSFYELEEAVEGADAFTEIKQLLEPVLVRLWKQGRLKCQKTA